MGTCNRVDCFVNTPAVEPQRRQCQVAFDNGNIDDLLEFVFLVSSGCRGWGCVVAGSRSVATGAELTATCVNCVDMQQSPTA